MCSTSKSIKSLCNSTVKKIKADHNHPYLIEEGGGERRGKGKRERDGERGGKRGGEMERGKREKEGGEKKKSQRLCDLSKVISLTDRTKARGVGARGFQVQSHRPPGHHPPRQDVVFLSFRAGVNTTFL